MMTFFWSKRSVRKKISKINDDEERTKAKNAYAFLKQSAESSYMKFNEDHAKFLRKHKGKKISDRLRKRPLQFIKEVGLECAIWPHLYWRTDMCESYERATDSRRIERLAKKKRASLNDLDSTSSDENEGESEDDAEGLPQRHSPAAALVGC